MPGDAEIVGVTTFDVGCVVGVTITVAGVGVVGAGVAVSVRFTADGGAV